jgi:hypothetical protein
VCHAWHGRYDGTHGSCHGCRARITSGFTGICMGGGICALGGTMGGRIREFSGSMRGFTGGATGGGTGGPMLLMKMRNNKEMQIIEMEIMIHECLCILYDFVCLYGI